jgi:hypothetical protein
MSTGARCSVVHGHDLADFSEGVCRPPTRRRAGTRETYRQCRHNRSDDLASARQLGSSPHGQLTSQPVARHWPAVWRATRPRDRPSSSAAWRARHRATVLSHARCTFSALPALPLLSGRLLTGHRPATCSGPVLRGDSAACRAGRRSTRPERGRPPTTGRRFRPGRADGRPTPCAIPPAPTGLIAPCRAPSR